MIDPRILAGVPDLITLLERKRLKVATAESCTAGLVVAALTSVSGSAAVVDRGFVTYSNEAKTEMLGVSDALIAKVGAVSEEVARAMAEGALAHSRADIAVSITGIAGPTGGTEQKPVGLVHFGAVRKGGEVVHMMKRYPPELERAGIREAATAEALGLIRRLAEEAPS
ncbi:MAG: CinA family protein [Bauldia sp.]|nr:CinA family protein [Bauldia sp.]